MGSRARCVSGLCARSVGAAFAREHELTHRAMKSWAANENIEVLGNPDPSSRVGIISFNIRDAEGRYLHHKFLTALLNDLFGIQSRAGCSCAGSAIGLCWWAVVPIWIRRRALRRSR